MYATFNLYIHKTLSAATCYGMPNIARHSAAHAKHIYAHMQYGSTSFGNWRHTIINRNYSLLFAFQDECFFKYRNIFGIWTKTYHSNFPNQFSHIFRVGNIHKNRIHPEKGHEKCAGPKSPIILHSITFYVNCTTAKLVHATQQPHMSGTNICTYTIVYMYEI